MRAAATVPLALLLVCPLPARACDGDCNANEAVSIDELIMAVNIAIGTAPIAECRAADRDGNGIIGVEEIIAAVAGALNGCSDETCGNAAVEGVEECDDGNRLDGDGCTAACALEPGGDPCAGVASTAGTAAVSALVTDALSNPVHIAAPPLDPRRLFVLEQGGYVRLIKDGVLLATPFLDLHTLVSCCGERGLLGLAFDPDYETNGRFFVDYTDTRGDTVIARYLVTDDPDRANPESGQTLLTIDQPYSNHNGGQLAFGPDGYLYIGMGDGGSGGDPQENAQNDTALLGKLLRLDVDVDEAPFYRVPPGNPHAERGAPLGLIWAKGLRNPWRFSFDRATGDLYIADVGQGDIEEIDVQPAASTGGENYGWDVFEGTQCFDPAPQFETCPDPPTGYVHPVLEYGHTGGRCSITGGFVYRGCAMPDLRGQYLFADFCTPFIESFRLVDGRATDIQNLTEALAPGGGYSIRNVSTFGEDTRGELYIADYDGEIYKIVPPPTAVP